MRSSIIVASFGLLFGVAVLVLVPTNAGRDGYAAFADIQSPAFFPLMLATLLIVISLTFLCMTLFAALCGSNAGETHDTGVGPIESPLRVAATAAALVTYYVLLSWIGMLAASVLLIVALSLILGFRKHWVTAAVAVILPLAVYMLFQRGLYVMLPEGRLF